MNPVNLWWIYFVWRFSICGPCDHGGVGPSPRMPRELGTSLDQSGRVSIVGGENPQGGRVAIVEGKILICGPCDRGNIGPFPVCLENWRYCPTGVDESQMWKRKPTEWPNLTCGRENARNGFIGDSIPSYRSGKFMERSVISFLYWDSP